MCSLNEIKNVCKCRRDQQFQHTDVLNYTKDVPEATRVRKEGQHTYLIESIEKVAN
jgi:hypothetical protein